MNNGVLEETVLALNPKNISLPKKISSTLDLKIKLTLEKDPVAEERYLIFITGPLIHHSFIYGDNDKRRAKRVYDELLNDFKKGNYKIKVNIGLEVSPDTQLYPDIP